MPDQDQLVTLSVVAVDFVMDLDHERARRVDDLQPAPFGHFPDRLGDAVRAEDHGLAVRHFAEFLNEDRAFQLERVDDVAAMHNLMPDVDRRPIGLERQLHDVDGPVHAGAETSGIGEIDIHGSVCFFTLLRPGIATSFALSASSVARPAGIEPATTSLEGWGSLQLSYGRVCVVGARGFEPPTASSQSWCATRLRYAPTSSC